jgi:hypothetical protein
MGPAENAARGWAHNLPCSCNSARRTLISHPPLNHSNARQHFPLAQVTFCALSGICCRTAGFFASTVAGGNTRQILCPASVAASAIPSSPEACTPSAHASTTSSTTSIRRSPLQSARRTTDDSAGGSPAPTGSCLRPFWRR